MLSPNEKLGLALSLTVIGAAGIGITYEKCVKTREPVWDDSVVKPIPPVKLALSGELSEYTEAYKNSISEWNARVGCRIFVDEPTDAAYIIVLGSANASGAAHFDRGSTIYINSPSDIRSVGIAMRHELGHVLGLAHDNHSQSMMFSNALDFANSFPGPRITDKDAEAVKKAYCKTP